MFALVICLACALVGALADHYLERKVNALVAKLKKAAADLKS